MKKILSVIIVVIFNIPTYAQDSNKSLGFEFSPTVTFLRGNSIVDHNDARVSFSSGLSFEYFINSMISIKSGLGYERKGTQSKNAFTDEFGNIIGDAGGKTNYNYLILPIMGSFSTKGRTKFYLNLGQYFGFLINAKTIVKSASLQPNSIDVDETDSSKRLDLGLTFGLGFNIPLGNKLLLDFGLRENYGLFNISKVNVIDNGTIKTNSIGIQMGLKFKL